MHQRIAYFFLFILLAIPYSLQAAPGCSQLLATAISIQGKIDTQYTEGLNWHPIVMGHRFCYGDKVRTSKHSRVTLVFKNGPRITLDQNSTLSFSSTTEKKTSWIINLLKGSSFIRSRQSQRLNVQTPFINAVHEGTEFLVKVDSQQTEITVFDGQVAANNQMGSINIKKGFKGIATSDQLPRVQALTIQPEDAVQWSLYYPAIVDLSSFKNSIYQPTLKAYQQGNINQALTFLENIPLAQHDSTYLTLKSAILLTLSSVDESTLLINKILSLDPNNSSAFALQSIIEVSKNRQDIALKLAKKAVRLNSKSATAQIALSYAYQSQLKINNAVTATEKAVRLSPDNALAWARLAELQLSIGERSDALQSAQKAQTLNPFLGRTQTVLGFSYLAQVDIDEAKKAFTQAIKLDSSDPLAHLGLGLAKIRKGDIQAGTHAIETAVSLDPNNSIMRSYLGKSYYELRNNEYAATELSIAKEIDPNDPTPWFYDAIRKQTRNQPVDALNDMQKAIELNDNRGVYRSKLLLDEDSAARSANMARIYQDLDFDRVALKQAWTSLSQDSTNPSAHRFLSDTLQGKPRHRIARASELLQAQLFQPINIVPVQPQLTSENIGVLNSTGPGSLSSNEYDSLFTANGAHVFLNGAVGSNNTLTDSAIISGVYDQLSLSFGQFHYQTDGFRINDDYEQNIYNAFAQVALTDALNVQVEFKTEDIKAGDVPLNSNDFHQENLRQSIDHDTARFGLHYKISSEQDFIFSTFYIENEELDTNLTETTRDAGFGLTDFLTFNDKRKHEDSGYQFEIQHLLNLNYINLVTGVGYLNIDTTDSESRQTLIRTPPFIPTPIPSPLDSNLTDTAQEVSFLNSYIYSTINIYQELTTILGISYDSYKSKLIKIDQFNPKLGLIWTPINNLTIRSAVFRTLKRPLVANQTIEPTQIAGFNQFFDNNNGTKAWQYGFGLDYNPFKNVFVGSEVSLRDIRTPKSENNTTKFRKREELSHSVYFYLTPLSWVALSSEYQFEKYRREHSINQVDPTSPKSVTTHQIPVNFNFYFLNNFFSNFSGTYVSQEVKYVNNNNGIDKNNNSFWVFDTSLGFKLPKKIGSLSIEVNNLFDNKFKYNSTFDSSGPQISGYIPEREIFFKLNITY